MIMIYAVPIRLRYMLYYDIAQQNGVEKCLKLVKRNATCILGVRLD